MANCIHDGTPARLEFLAYPAQFGMDDQWEPICQECQDSIGHKWTRDTCDCDEGHVCEYHALFCPICERERDTDGPLCKRCEATARAWARSEQNARRFPDPERS